MTFYLSFFAGKQRDQYPPYGLCVAQASMVNGALPMLVHTAYHFGIWMLSVFNTGPRLLVWVLWHT